MPNLNQFVYCACGGVNYRGKDKVQIEHIVEHFYKFCETYDRLNNYYFILHDDTDILHIHFCFLLKAQTRLMTIFNKLSDYLWLDIEKDNNSIEIEKCNNLNSMLRYFLHIDKVSKASSKKVYDISDIVSNDSINSIEGIINSVKDNVDVYYLRNAILDSSNEFELMNKLGLKIYHKYRYEIQELKEMRILLAKLREEEMEGELDLPF